MPKKPLEIPPLPKIEDLVWKKLAFFPYSTHLRNIAYLLQLREFFTELYSSYNINRGLAATYLMNLNRLDADIAEGLLFCILRHKNLLETSRNNKGLGHNLQVAKKKGIISKKTAKKLELLVEIRNLLHPKLQTELHINVVTLEAQYTSLIDIVIEDIRSYIKKSWLIEEPIKVQIVENFKPQEDCMYCRLGMFPGQQCPSCGEISF